jgi:lipopolysaccharide/colanic/teichoic acid biosynthesis glycosyltransferase
VDITAGHHGGVEGCRSSGGGGVTCGLSAASASPFGDVSRQTKRYSTAVSGYVARLRVKPGVTGWAQVNGWRGPTDTLEQIQQRFTYDLYYIQYRSLWFVLQILLQTVIRGFVHKYAY